jgi:predicted ATPase
VHLKIKNIGKINDSTIEMNGITVIAGENNTGKSTFGKVLYCMFNAFYNAKAAIHNERVDAIRNIFYYNTSPRDFKLYMLDRLSLKMVDEIANSINEEISEDDIKNNIINIITEQLIFLEKADNNFIAEIAENIIHSLVVNDNEIQRIIISRYFYNEFEGKINHVNKHGTTGKISLDIHKKNVDVIIKRNECDSFIDNVGIRHNAIYIDTPFIIDDNPTQYKRNLPARSLLNNNMRINHRRNLLHHLGKELSDNTVIEEVIINKKISNILSTINSVTQGEFREDKEGLFFMESGLKKPLALSSISAGMKAFLIIKRLLELGEIKERNILILDEPEIHLHPAWQLQFAEILVLLQKEFDLTILLATHSPYFLNAVEVYSEKHKIKNRMNIYLAENNGDTSDVREATNNIDVIYKQLALPFQKLEDTIYED